MIEYCEFSFGNVVVNASKLYKNDIIILYSVVWHTSLYNLLKWNEKKYPRLVC